MGERNNRIKLKYETNKYAYDLKFFQMIRPTSERIFKGKVTISKADKIKGIY